MRWCWLSQLVETIFFVKENNAKGLPRLARVEIKSSPRCSIHDRSRSQDVLPFSTLHHLAPTCRGSRQSSIFSLSSRILFHFFFIFSSPSSFFPYLLSLRLPIHFLFLPPQFFFLLFFPFYAQSPFLSFLLHYFFFFFPFFFFPGRPSPPIFLSFFLSFLPASNCLPTLSSPFAPSTTKNPARNSTRPNQTNKQKKK